MMVKMTILRLLGSSDDKEKEKIGVARPEGQPLRGFRYPVSGRGSRGSLKWCGFQRRLEAQEWRRGIWRLGKVWGA